MPLHLTCKHCCLWHLLTQLCVVAVEVNRQGLYQPEGHIINLRILERPGVVLPVHVGEHRPSTCFHVSTQSACL